MAENETLEKPLSTKVGIALPVKEKAEVAKPENGKVAPVKEAEKADKGKVEDDGEIYVDFSLDGSQKEEPKTDKGKEDKGKGEESKPNYSRFKEYVGKDEISEDDIETGWKKDREELATYKTKASKLEVLAQGSNKLKEDKEYQSWKNWLGAKPEDLVTTSLAYDFMEDGLDEKAAGIKAKERLDEEIEKNPHWVEDTARGIRKNLKGLLAQKEHEVKEQIENASKDISFVNPTSDFEGKVKETWSKTEDFLGMKFSKDEKERTKLVSDAYIHPTKMNEVLKDPTTYQEVCMYLKYKKIWKANIDGRTNGKSKVLDRLPKVPSVGSGLTTRMTPTPSTGKSFNGASFLGR